MERYSDAGKKQASLRVGLVLLLVLLFSPACFAQAAPTPSGAFALVTVEIAGSGPAIEREARRKALTQKIEEVAGAGTDDPRLDEILTQAHKLTVIKSNREQTNGKSRVVVEVCLAFAPEGKKGLLGMLLAHGLMRPLRIAVVVPEEHRVETVPVRVPDPAGETALANYLETAGFANTDPGIAARLRDQVVIRQALQGDLSGERMRELKNRQSEIDVLIVGEAFSVERRGGTTVGGLPFCEANVEIKALDPATGARVYSDRERASARGATGATAGKAALEEAGRLLAPRVAEALLLWSVQKRNRSGVGPVVTRRLEIGGIKKASQSEALLEAIGGIAGVTVVRSEYEGGVLFATLEAETGIADRLAGKIEGLPGFRLEFSGTSGGLLKGLLR